MSEENSYMRSKQRKELWRKRTYAEQSKSVENNKEYYDKYSEHKRNLLEIKNIIVWKKNLIEYKDEEILQELEKKRHEN